MGQEAKVAIAATYRRFSEMEAEGKSELYAELTGRIADDPEVLAFLAALPPAKRQPNLVLASFRSLFGTPDSWAEFRDRLLDSRDLLTSRILERSTQTNEPRRCAALLPVLAQLPQPLALIEVGAAAGLCLLPDKYSYRFGPEHYLLAADEDAPCFSCEANAATPIPGRLPSVAWRIGLDLNPLDVSDPDAMSWLETLVWPGQDERRDNLRRAVAVARKEPPSVVKGDLLRGLRALCESAPDNATLVIFHSAVLSYVAPQSRDAFAAEALDLADVWISNESPSVFPEIAARAGRVHPGKFLVAKNGAPLAWTDPHGASIEWIDSIDTPSH